LKQPRVQTKRWPSRQNPRKPDAESVKKMQTPTMKPLQTKPEAQREALCEALERLALPRAARREVQAVRKALAAQSAEAST